MQIYFFEQLLLLKTDRCTMGGPFSVIFSDIYVVKLESDIAQSLKPKVYRRCVEDMFNRGKVSTIYILFELLNNYHPRIKLFIKLDSKRSLDQKLVCVNGIYNTMVSRKSRKLPMA